MSHTQLTFLIMVFVAVFLLAYGLFLPALGDDRKQRRRLQARLKAVTSQAGEHERISLLRKRYLDNLSGRERWLETLPGMERLRELIEQSGHDMPAYRVALMSLASGLVVWLLADWLSHQAFITVPLAVLGAAVPVWKLRADRVRRFARFDEQLPTALDTIQRALRAGHPFIDAVRLAAEDLGDPMGTELTNVFSDIRYGTDPRAALLALLHRVPSVNVMAVVTSVLIQRETGGNLAEVLEKISAVIRSRFRFYRKVKTLSAEARLSAWILALIPFVLAALMTAIAPGYISMLTKNPTGHKLIAGAFVMFVVGVFWMRHIIRIRV